MYRSRAAHGARVVALLGMVLVGLVATPRPAAAADGSPPAAGYWLVASDGGIFGFGSAPFRGSTGAIRLSQPIVGMAPTPTGEGYWLVAADGGIFAFGDAAFRGSTGATRINQPIVAMAPTPSGNGYWLVASDGGIFAFGDAGFQGSTGSIRLTRPIVGMAPTRSGKGYWLAASDGGIFTFGDASFRGSMGAARLNRPIVGMAATPSGGGYWLVASDGGIFTFGDALFHGSTGATKLNRPITGMAASTALGNLTTLPGDLKVSCNSYASTSGSDSNPGTFEAPYRSIGKLVVRLSPGQTGCLLGGTFVGNVSIRNGGRSGSPIILASAPGYRATIAGQLSVSRSASDVTIANLNLNGRNSSGSASPQINADRVTLRSNDITNEHTGICILLGGSFAGYGRADGVVVDSNRIHNCGRLPATNHDHGIYVEAARGTRIVNNVFYDNADWGVHLYPDADASYVAHNIIDGNGKGVIFAGERSGGEYNDPHSSDDNIVELNIVSNPSIGDNIESWWGGPVGVGNIARRNCLWKAGGSGLDLSRGGFSADANITADPRYVNRAAKDFRLLPGSPCAAMAPLS